VTVTLALVSCALLFVGPLVVWGLSVRHTARASASEREQKAYSDLLTASLGISSRATTMLSTLQNRSGLQEGVMVTFRQRAPIDPLHLHDWIGTDLRPLYDAWSRAWTYGSAEGVALANRLFDSCGEVMGVINQTKATGLKDKSRHVLFGIDTDRLAPQLDERIKALATARRDLADYMRRETGRAPADLFSSTVTNTLPRTGRLWRRQESGSSPKAA
jgi:hypothetical protein